MGYSFPTGITLASRKISLLHPATCKYMKKKICCFSGLMKAGAGAGVVLSAPCLGLLSDALAMGIRSLWVALKVINDMASELIVGAALCKGVIKCHYMKTQDCTTDLSEACSQK